MSAALLGEVGGLQRVGVLNDAVDHREQTLRCVAPRSTITVFAVQRVFGQPCNYADVTRQIVRGLALGGGLAGGRGARRRLVGQQLPRRFHLEGNSERFEGRDVEPCGRFLGPHAARDGIAQPHMDRQLVGVLPPELRGAVTNVPADHGTIVASNFTVANDHTLTYNTSVLYTRGAGR